MAPDFTSAMTILQHVEGWVKSVVGWKQSRDAHNREQTGAALKALVAATSATRQYLAAVRRDPSSQDFAKQSKLAELWGEAAFTMHEINPGISLLYLRKAEYWSDPEGWTDAQKDDRIILLDDLSHLGEKALLGDQSNPSQESALS